MDTEKYLGYLDKEMTIMGILSAFAVAAPAGILSAVLSKDVYSKVTGWDSGQFFLIAGSILCVVAASFFYKQRSDLAWNYGQICLCQTLGGGGTDLSVLREWLRDSDSWATWWPYSVAFTMLWAGFVEYLPALFLLLRSGNAGRMVHHEFWWRIGSVLLCPLIAILIATLQFSVLTHYEFDEKPWLSFRCAVFKRPCPKAAEPHKGVYARIKRSSIHGVGVVAIIDIPKGTYIFEPDNDELVRVSMDDIKLLHEDVQRLYQDFCVLRAGTYQCPSNFNRLTPAWFVNNSKQPNLAADSDLKFYSIRPIVKGEELTADYETYSEAPTKMAKQ